MTHTPVDPEVRKLAAEAAQAIRFADVPRLERLIVELEERYGLAPADSRNRQRSTDHRKGSS